jgi:hypothetical protein
MKIPIKNMKQYREVISLLKRLGYCWADTHEKLNIPVGRKVKYLKIDNNKGVLWGDKSCCSEKIGEKIEKELKENDIEITEENINKLLMIESLKK